MHADANMDVVEQPHYHGVSWPMRAEDMPGEGCER